METEYVYRIRRKSDGWWFGKKPRFKDDRFHKVMGPYFSKHALSCILASYKKEEIEKWEVLKYALKPVALYSDPTKAIE